MPTSRNSSIARSRRALRSSPIWMRSTSSIWKPTVKQGLRLGDRLLEDHRDILADDLAALGIAEMILRMSLPFEQHAIGGDLRRPGQKPHDGEHGDRLAQNRIRQRSPELHPSSTVSETPSTARNQAGGRLEFDGEVFDFEERHDHDLFSFGSRASRRPSPIRLMARTVMRIRQAGEGNDPPGALRNELTRLGKHRAPFRRRRLGAHAEEAERCRIEDGGSRRRASPARSAAPSAVRQDRQEHQPQRTGAGDARADDIVLVALRHDGGARQADEMRLVARGQMAIMALSSPAPRIATSTRASSSDGKARMMSITRMMMVSTRSRG
jgi:hypothetical protein